MEELGEDMTESKYDELVQSLTDFGVSLKDVTGDYKSTYQIMSEIAAQWDKMSDERKSALVTALAGTRQQDIFYSIINQFKEAQGAYNDMMNNSVGALTTAYSTYMESATAHINQFKAAFQELSANFIQTGFINGVVDFGKGLVNILNTVAKMINKIGGLKTVLIAVAGILATIKAEALKTLVLTTLPMKIEKITLALKGVFSVLKALPAIMAAFNSQTALALPGASRFAVILKLLKINATTAQVALGALAAAIAMTVLVYTKLKQKREEEISAAKEAASTAASETRELTDLINKYNELYDAMQDGKGSREDFIEAQDRICDKLDIQRDKLIELIALYGNYHDAILSASIDELQKQRRDLLGGVDATREELVETGLKNSRSHDVDITGHPTKNYTIVGSALGEDWEGVLTAIDALEKAGFSASAGLFRKFDILDRRYDFNNPDEIIALYNNLGEMLDVLSDNSDNLVYDKIYEAYSQLTPVIKSYSSAVDDLNNNVAQEALQTALLGKENPKTQEEFEAMRKEMIKNVKETKQFIGSEEDIANAIDGVLSKESRFTSFVAAAADAEKNAVERAGRIQGIFDGLSLNQNTINPDAINEYLDGLSDAEIEIAYKIVKAEGSLSLDELKKGVDELKKTELRINLKTDVQAYTAIEALDAGFKKLGEIYSDIQDGGTFDWSKILNDSDFEDTFGKYTESYNEFLEIVSESPSDINACQQAFNKLAKAYVVGTGALDDLSLSSRNTAIAMLEQKGVTNAAEVVDAALARTTSGLAQKFEALTGKTIDFANATEDEVRALYDNCAAGSEAQSVAARLLIEKMRLNNTKINTSQECEQLLNLAKAAGAGAQYIINLQKALTYLNNIPTVFRDEYGNVLRGIEYAEARQKYIQNAYKLAENAMKEMDFDLGVDVNFGGYNGGANNVGGGGGNKTTEPEEDPFDALYKEHKHAVEMEQETLEQFYAWLDGSDGYKKYYKEGTENFWKYEEEVKKGYRDLFKDMMSDMEHEISMREMFEGELKAIDALYVEMIKMVEDRIAQARHDGLSDESDYIQELQKLLQKYANDRAKLREDAQKAAIDSVDDLVEIRVKMLKQDIKNERDALKKRLDELKKFYDKQKEMLRDANDEEKYLEEQAEKRRKVFDLESQLRQLDLDDSAWAQKKKLELEQELADARKELDDFERDHALEMAEDQLDKQYEAREAAINKYDELLEEQEDDEITLYAKALADVRSGSLDLYNEMLEWNKTYGDGINDTITNAWNTAYIALNDYKDLFGSLYEDIKLFNAAARDSGFAWDTMQASDAGAKGGDSFVDYSMEKGNGGFIPGDIDGDGRVTTSDARLAVRAAVGLEKLSDKEIKRGDLDGDGKISTGDARRILRLAVGLDKQGYASGTSNATPGIHRIDEYGDETIFSSRDGNKYKLFSGGEKVLNARASNFLYNFANSGGDMIKRAIGSAVTAGLNNLFAHGGSGIDIRTGDIIINGNADKATVSEMRRAQREQVETILKSFNRLKA